MKIVVTGGKGQLASEIKRIYSTGTAEIGKCPVEGANIEFIDIDELDITDIKAVREYFNNKDTDIIINCAAYTNVEAAERDFDLAFKINALGPRNLAIVSEEIGAKLIHVSTDYVFSGDDNKLLREYDIPSPKSVYGYTKYLGEKYIEDFSNKYFIVRTAWLYGYSTSNNFVYKMIKIAKENDTRKVVSDQIGTPTNANDLAYHLLKLCNTEEYGIYHCTGKGQCSWYDFAKKIVELSGEKCEIKPCATNEFPTEATRPVYSPLDNMMLRATVGDEMRPWDEAVECFIKKIKGKEL